MVEVNTQSRGRKTPALINVNQIGANMDNKPPADLGKKVIKRPAQALAKLLKSYEITDWDYLLIGDGSGTTWEHECGWASTLICRKSKNRKAFYGAMSEGTNIVAEIMAYLHPLLFLTTSKIPPKAGGHLVHIFTDCQPLVTCWKTKDVRNNKLLWNLISQMQRLGFVFQFHWIPRDTYQLNQFADAAAGTARKSLVAVNVVDLALKTVQKKWTKRQIESVFDLNSSTTISPE